MIDTSYVNGQRGLLKKKVAGWNIKFDSDADLQTFQGQIESQKSFNWNEQLWTADFTFQMRDRGEKIKLGVDQHSYIPNGSFLRDTEYAIGIIV